MVARALAYLRVWQTNWFRFAVSNQKKKIYKNTKCHDSWVKRKLNGAPTAEHWCIWCEFVWWLVRQPAWQIAIKWQNYSKIYIKNQTKKTTPKFPFENDSLWLWWLRHTPLNINGSSVHRCTRSLVLHCFQPWMKLTSQPKSRAKKQSSVQVFCLVRDRWKKREEKQ